METTLFKTRDCFKQIENSCYFVFCVQSLETVKVISKLWSTSFVFLEIWETHRNNEVKDRLFASCVVRQNILLFPRRHLPKRAKLSSYVVFYK